jgi:hypothetical protein
MQDKPLFDLYSEFEAQLIAQVLDDEGISYRIDPLSQNYWGVIFGEGLKDVLGYAKLWCYVKDKERIGELLDAVRASQPLEVLDPTYGHIRMLAKMSRPQMWRIKRS